MDWSQQVGEGPANYQGFLVPGMFTPFAERLVSDLEIVPGSAVLDLACGTGVVTRLAARASGPTGTVTGVDIGPAMLAVARALPAEPDSAPIRYLEGSAQELPLAADAVDVATCHHGFQFFPDRPAAAQELRRVLRPGGRVAIACWTGLEQTPVFRAIRDALAAHVDEDAAAMMQSPFAVPAAELAALLEGAGFGEVRVERIELTASLPAVSDIGPRVIAAGPVAGPFSQAPRAAQEALAAAVADATEPYLDGDTVRFPLSSNVAFGTA